MLEDQENAVRTARRMVEDHGLKVAGRRAVHYAYQRPPQSPVTLYWIAVIDEIRNIERKQVADGITD